MVLPVQDYEVSGGLGVAPQDVLKVQDLPLQLGRVTLPVENGGGEAQDPGAARTALKQLMGIEPEKHYKYS